MVTVPTVLRCSSKLMPVVSIMTSPPMMFSLACSCARTKPDTTVFSSILTQEMTMIWLGKEQSYLSLPQCAVKCKGRECYVKSNSETVF